MTAEEKKDEKIDYTQLDVDDLIPEEVKIQIEKSIKSLERLYNEEIDNEDTNVQKTLEFLPLFNIHGLILSSMLGVTMEEYYMITEAYAKKMGLLK